MIVSRKKEWYSEVCISCYLIGESLMKFEHIDGTKWRLIAKQDTTEGLFVGFVDIGIEYIHLESSIGMPWRTL
jgi:hypothetical protein